MIAKQLLRQRSGAAAAEFALALPVLMLMMFPTIDLAMAFAAEQRLVSAAAQAVQSATARNQVQSSYTPLTADANSAAAGAVKASITSSVTHWLECNGVRSGNANGVCPGGQRYARYVEVTVRSTYTPIFPSFGLLDAKMPISGRAAVRVQ